MRRRREVAACEIGVLLQIIRDIPGEALTAALPTEARHALARAEEDIAMAYELARGHEANTKEAV